MVCIDNGILLRHKKEQNNAICSNMNEMTDHIKWSQKQEDKYHDITYMWNFKYDTNDPIYKTWTDS